MATPQRPQDRLVLTGIAGNADHGTNSRQVCQIDPDSTPVDLDIEPLAGDGVVLCADVANAACPLYSSNILMDYRIRGSRYVYIMRA